MCSWSLLIVSKVCAGVLTGRAPRASLTMNLEVIGRRFAVRASFGRELAVEIVEEAGRSPNRASLIGHDRVGGFLLAMRSSSRART